MPKQPLTPAESTKMLSHDNTGKIPVFCAFDRLADPKTLIGNPRNPNKHPQKQIDALAKIIQAQGWRAPITVSNRSGFVVRGHGRLAAALAFGAKAHCVFTDPPYGVSYVSQSGKFEMLKNDMLTGDNLMKTLLLPAFKSMFAHTVDDAAFYVWHSGSTRRDFEDALMAAGLTEKQTIIWAKPGFVLGHDHYQWAHEPCFYCGQRPVASACRLRAGRGALRKLSAAVKRLLSCRSSGTLAPKGKKCRAFLLSTDNTVTIRTEAPNSTLWEVARDVGAEHPTQKPVELVTRALENSTQPGEIVLDLFGGSGSTLIGAEQMGRVAYLAELDPQYADVIINRYAKLTTDNVVTCIRAGKTIPLCDLR